MQNPDESGLFHQSGDYGDSSHFTGLYVMATGNIYPWLWIEFTDYKYRCRRHKDQEPWNNPWNFTRDQLMPLVAGLAVQESKKCLKRIFYKHLLRGFFTQSFQRDYPGTWKYPFPHKVNGKWRLFDFADLLLPHHIMALAVAADFKWAKLLSPIAYLTLVSELLVFRFGDNDDQGAMIATCAILNKLHWFRFINPQWDKKLDRYCNGWRNQTILYASIKGFVTHNRGI